jgi:hypothetical protein
MLQSVMELVLGFIAEWLLWLLCWVVLFPVVWILSLPVILLLAAFRRGSYGFNVTMMFSAVHNFWWNWGASVPF